MNHLERLAQELSDYDDYLDTIEPPERDDWIYTYSGKRFYFLNPTPDSICIEDIAHSLSLLTRFNGHIQEHYSVAQHSIYVSSLLKPEYRLAGLLHDASEAFAGDLVAPLKRLLHSHGNGSITSYDDVERGIVNAVALRFDYLNDEATHAAIKVADITLLLTEARDLFKHPLNLTGGKYEGLKPLPFVIKPWTAKVAEYRFLEIFYSLNGPCQ